MSKIALQGDALGTGTTTLASANTNTSTTFVLPSADGTNGQVIQTNGSGVLSFTTVASGGDYIMNVYSTPGTWTKPAGLKAIKVTVIGGGGGSGGGPQLGTGGGGGGSSIEYIDAPAIPGPQPYTVGTGGTAGSPSPVLGGTGGTSSFGGPTAFLSATGGTGGGINSPGPNFRGEAGVAGGTGSNGQLNIAGENGTGGINPGGLGLSGGTILGSGIYGYFGDPPSPGAPRGYGVGGIGINTATGAGSAGGAGVVIVEEFY